IRPRRGHADAVVEDDIGHDLDRPQGAYGGRQLGLAAVGAVEDVPPPRDVALRGERVGGWGEPDPAEAGGLDRGGVFAEQAVPPLALPARAPAGVRGPVETLQDHVAAVAVVLRLVRRAAATDRQWDDRHPRQPEFGVHGARGPPAARTAGGAARPP